MGHFFFIFVLCIVCKSHGLEIKETHCVLVTGERYECNADLYCKLNIALYSRKEVKIISKTKLQE